MTFTSSLLFNCQVFVDVDNKNEWRDCFDVSGVKLPTGLYFGASAATGQLAGIYKDLTFVLFLLYFYDYMPGKRNINIVLFLCRQSRHHIHEIL